MSRQEEKALEYQNANLNAAPYDAFLDGYQYAVEKACEWLREHLGAPVGIPQAKSYNDAINELTTEFRKGMEE